MGATGTHVHFECEVGGDGQQQISPDHVVVLVDPSLLSVSDGNKRIHVTQTLTG